MAEFSIAQIRGAHALREGIVIPAHPLALTPARKLDERRQRALTRYYHAAGAGGIAVGVHTTQFAIRDHGLLKPVLELAATTAADCDSRRPPHPDPPPRWRRGKKPGLTGLIAVICVQ